MIAYVRRFVFLYLMSCSFHILFGPSVYVINNTKYTWNFQLGRKPGPFYPDRGYRAHGSISLTGFCGAGKSVLVLNRQLNAADYYKDCPAVMPSYSTGWIDLGPGKDYNFTTISAQNRFKSKIDFLKQIKRTEIRHGSVYFIIEEKDGGLYKVKRVDPNGYFTYKEQHWEEMKQKAGKS